MRMIPAKVILCPFTGEKFTQRRPNQVYSNRRAQVSAANMRAREKRLAKSFIQKKLDRNREVLKNLLGKESSIVLTMEYCKGAGMDLGCYTHFKIIDKINQTIEFYVFDYAFQKVGLDKIRIFKAPIK
jgi:hypothetical protein